MKELVYPRLFETAARHWAAKPCVIDGGYRATFASTASACCAAPALRTSSELARGDRFAVMAAQLPPVPRALPRRLPRRRRHQPAQPASRRQGARLHRARLRHRGRVRRSPLRRRRSTRRCTRPAARARSADRADRRGRTRRRPTTCATRSCSPRSAPEVPDEPEEDDPVVLMYTGGTTGLPKGVLGLASAPRCSTVPPGDGVPDRRGAGVPDADADLPRRLDGPDRSALPALGGTLGDRCRASSPAEALELDRAPQRHAHGLVPTMIGMILNHPSFAPERLRLARLLVYGASPMPEALLDAAARAVPRHRARRRATA